MYSTNDSYTTSELLRQSEFVKNFSLATPLGQALVNRLEAQEDALQALTPIQRVLDRFGMDAETASALLEGLGCHGVQERSGLSILLEQSMRPSYVPISFE